MISGALKELVDRLQTLGTMRFFEPASEGQIAAFERNSSVKLPSGYREWLLFSDGGELFLPAGVQLYGVTHKPVIDADDSDRPDSRYTVIGALASGDPLLCEEQSERISIYNLAAGRVEKDEVYRDFHAFLNDLYDLLGMGE